MTVLIYLLLVFTIFEVLKGPIHGGNELETSNCNERHSDPHKNIVQHRVFVLLEPLAILKHIAGAFRSVSVKKLKQVQAFESDGSIRFVMAVAQAMQLVGQQCYFLCSINRNILFYGLADSMTSIQAPAHFRSLPLNGSF
jgi:hypothetical protein